MPDFPPGDDPEARKTTSLNSLAGSDDPFPFLRADETRLMTSVQPDEGWAGHPNPPADPAASPPSPSSTDNTESTPGTGSTAALPDPLPVALNISTADGTSRVPMEQPRFLIGRDCCDFEVDDPYMDDVHLQIFAKHGKLMVADIDSTNGVFLRIADDLTMADGDEVLVGDQRLRFRATWSNGDDANDADDAAVTLGASPAGPPARIERVLRGGDIASIVPIEDEMTVGRETGDLTCPEDVALSDPHARIVRSGETYTIRDLSSESGTFIRIHNPVQLVDGDCVIAGRTRVQVEL